MKDVSLTPEEIAFIARALKGYLSEWVGAMSDADEAFCAELLEKFKRLSQ